MSTRTPGVIKHLAAGISTGIILVLVLDPSDSPSSGCLIVLCCRYDFVYLTIWTDKATIWTGEDIIWTGEDIIWPGEGTIWTGER